jgi:hypothetical protein
VDLVEGIVLGESCRKPGKKHESADGKEEPRDGEIS